MKKRSEMKLAHGWKIMRRSKIPGNYRTLYKGIRGSREVGDYVWTKAERKWGTESGSKFYWTGFHVLEDLREMREYCRKFKRTEDMVVVSCLFIRGEKKPTNPKVELATHLQLRSELYGVYSVEELLGFDDEEVESVNRGFNDLIQNQWPEKCRRGEVRQAAKSERTLDQ